MSVETSIEADDLVQCHTTGRIGIVIEKKRAAWAMMALVNWPDSGTKWVDVVDVKIVHKAERR